MHSVIIDRSKMYKRAFKKRNIKTAMTAGMRELGKKVTDEAKYGILNSPRGYKEYGVVVNNVRITRESSYPNTYPADQTGDLRRSIGYRHPGSQLMEVYADVYYAGWVEEGHMWGRTYIEPRPFLTTADNSVGQTERKRILKKHVVKAWGV